jgi:hypothetical protein
VKRLLRQLDFWQAYQGSPLNLDSWRTGLASIHQRGPAEFFQRGPGGVLFGRGDPVHDIGAEFISIGFKHKPES